MTDYKTLGDAIGMPDEKDEEFLRELVKQYEKKSGGLLGYTVRQARREFESGRHGSLRNEKANVNSASNMRYVFELPESFVGLVERYFPTMFREPKHFNWFKKKLPGLMIRPK